MEETLEFYAVDNLDSKVVSFGINGSKINSFSYDTWGFNGSIEASFTGKQLDSTGLYYFNARYYDPVIGRFLTEDPNKQGMSWYTYCSNNPINMIDPDGKEPDPKTIIDNDIIAIYDSDKFISQAARNLVFPWWKAYEDKRFMAVGYPNIHVIKEFQKGERILGYYGLAMGQSGPGMDGYNDDSWCVQFAIRRTQANPVGHIDYIVDRLYQNATLTGGNFYVKIAYYMATSEHIDFNLQGFSIPNFLKDTIGAGGLASIENDGSDGVARFDHVTDWELNRAWNLERDKTTFWTEHVYQQENIMLRLAMAGVNYKKVNLDNEDNSPVRLLSKVNGKYVWGPKII